MTGYWDAVMEKEWVDSEAHRTYIASDIARDDQEPKRSRRRVARGDLARLRARLAEVEHERMTDE